MNTFHDDFRAMAATVRPSADTLALRRRAMVIEPVTRPAVARDSDGYGSYGMSCSLCGSTSLQQVCGRCSNHFAKGGTL